MQQQQTDMSTTMATAATTAGQAGQGGSSRVKDALVGKSFAAQVQMLAVDGAAGLAGVAGINSAPPPNIGGWSRKRVGSGDGREPWAEYEQQGAQGTG